MACQLVFYSLKKMLTKALILVYYKQDFKTIVKTDSSDYISNKVFSQLEKDGLLYFIVFFSKKFKSCWI